ncbi:hypothetical protein AAFF_G00368430 [Aldrovandia affinis]|uniref:non-specific serine/threonine protein kinase n=1 Tax=Aldrovandia affinis TaxID=143900 RepID=A0AAD7SGY6_9TELE|nr:hypothetical protein AAFF_G00368430 [Aldrovandia affinis]
MPRFLSVLEIWRFGSRHHPVLGAQGDEQHTETDTRAETTGDQANPGVTNKPSAVQPWPKSTSEEQNVALHGDDYSGYDDIRANTFCSTVEGLLTFTNSLMQDSLNDNDSHDLIWNSEAHQINRKGQVPAGEEEGTILDKHNKYSDVTSFAGGRAGDRKESSYPLGTEAAIGLPSDDSCLRMPPVETWPSTDSWSGTHSNAVHIVLPSPDESHAIVTQTLEAMAIKDREPEPLQSQENNDTAEQMCPITDGKDNGELTAERGVEKVQTLLKTQAGDTNVHLLDLRDKGDKETPLTEEHSSLETSEEEKCSSLSCTVASQNISDSDMTCIFPSSEDFTTIVESDIAKDIIIMKERTFAGEDDMDTYPEKKIPPQASEVERCQDTSEEPQTPERDEQAAPAETGQRKSYSEVVKQKSRTHIEVPKVLQNISAERLSDNPGSINLWCQFGALSVESLVVWTKEGVILEQAKRSTGDESRLSFQISKASSKDLGRYQCCLSCPLGRLASEFHLTSDVLNELIPCQNHTAEVVEGVGEDVKCAPLLFKGDFLSEQYFGENQPASIMTEEAHFGEGMYRRAFRTKLLSGMLSAFTPGHPCVLKVHNAISQGTKNNEELILKNYNLAVEECQVQNTAREYIKAYTTTAKSAEEFGEVPEIIPIFLVHRPSNDIPYATLEEELMGDFVKYSVKDGKEINLTRRESEPGQKCCAFQHWVYNMTEGNLLVTDMQGVGMRLTDVGIATPKKGYKGFKGNCATSFIDQFKALHQCNKFCELLGLKSLQPSQPKPRKTATAPKPKPQPQPKKKVFVFNLKSKS